VATYNLGKIYQYKLNDIKTALMYYEIASSKGDLESLYCLGMYHLSQDDTKAAIEYFEKGCEHPDSNAQLKVLNDKMRKLKL
jgi:TPR repeat protein